MDKTNLAQQYQELFGQPWPDLPNSNLSGDQVLTALRQAVILYNQPVSVEQITSTLYEGTSLEAVQVQLVQLRAAGLVRKARGEGVALFEPVKHSLYNEYRPVKNPDLKVKKNF